MFEYFQRRISILFITDLGIQSQAMQKTLYESTADKKLVSIPSPPALKKNLFSARGNFLESYKAS